MIQTVEAVVDGQGRIRLLEPVHDRWRVFAAPW
jgi:hypothetical protein